MEIMSFSWPAAAAGSALAAAVLATMYVAVARALPEAPPDTLPKAVGRGGAGTRPLPPGLANVGNSCFLNATLQALAACDSVAGFLRTFAKAERQAGVLPPPAAAAVADELREAVAQLRLVATRPRPLAPLHLIGAVEAFAGRSAHVRAAYQQDAHELYQIVADALSETAFALLRPPAPLSLFPAGVSQQSRVSAAPDKQKSRGAGTCPVLGMLASVVQCGTCGRFGKVRHSSFTCLSLPVPRTASARLDEMLDDLFAPNTLEGLLCEWCSLQATEKALVSQKKAAKTAAAAARIAAQLDAVRTSQARDPEAFSVSSDGADRVKVYSRIGSRQTLVARCPPTLVIHLSRSVFTPAGYAVRNPAAVAFDEQLSLDPWATSGPDGQYFPEVDGQVWRSSGRAAESSDAVPPVRYRLVAAVMHYGGHDSGHFVAYRRMLVRAGPRAGVQSYWVRASDANVTVVSDPHREIFEQGQSDVYMLYYQRLYFK